MSAAEQSVELVETRESGLVGLAFALDFGDKALAHARYIYCGTSLEVSPAKSYGFTPAHLMISPCVFTKAEALQCSEPLTNARVVKRWMIQTLY
jgi:hypothetical protein